MKKLSSLFCLILLSVVLWGQNDLNKKTKTDFKHQIGTDLSPLFRNLFKPNLRTNNLFTAPYILTFKSIKNNRAFRFGIGADIKREIPDDDSDDKILQNSLRIRMGFEKQKLISKRWQINTGIDLKFSNSKFDNGSNTNLNNKSNSYELSPLLGIQFQLTPHLYLQTEASFNFFYQVNSFKSNFDIIFPGPFPSPTAAEFKSYGGYISIPNALLLVVEF